MFAKNKLPSRIRVNECGINNNEDVPGRYGGTHWVAYFNTSKCPNIEFFDSFGLPPARPIEKYLLSSGKNIEYNSCQIQDESSVLCGHYCIHYIIERLQNKPFIDILNAFSLTRLKENDRLLTIFNDE